MERNKLNVAFGFGIFGVFFLKRYNIVKYQLYQPVIDICSNEQYELYDRYSCYK